MKKVLLGLSIVIMALLGAYIFFNLSMTNVADNFFSAIKKNNLKQAESYLSKGFKATTTNEQLVQYLIQYQLDNLKYIKWDKEKLLRESFLEPFKKLGIRTAVATVITAKGQKASIKVYYQREGASWKIFSIEKVLSKEEQKEKKIIADYTKLAQINIHHLAQAVHDNNMSIFYNKLSETWKKETTVKKLNESYGIFHKNKINLLVLDKVVPKLTTLNVDKKGILVLAGVYDLGKQKVNFVQNYISENKVWKLAGMTIQIK